MVQIDNEYFYIDLEAINTFVFKKNETTKKDDEEIITGSDGSLIQKTVISRNNDEDKYVHVRFDMVKTMLDVMYSTGIESDEGNIKYTQNIDDISLGSKLAFNTLLINGFVKNKLDK